MQHQCSMASGMGRRAMAAWPPPVCRHAFLLRRRVATAAHVDAIASLSYAQSDVKPNRALVTAVVHWSHVPAGVEME